MNVNNNAKAHQRSTQECDHASLKGCSQVLSFFTSAGDESGHTWYTKTSFFSSSSSSECTFSTLTAPAHECKKKLSALVYEKGWQRQERHIMTNDHFIRSMKIITTTALELEMMIQTAVGIEQQRGPFYSISLFSPFLPFAMLYVHLV